ncbi:60S ribosomal protein L18a-like protein [Lotus japonicus]|uniref:60S ribosomal protein L18a-like protein n=1 Tax=Lotus japonicus TaxID=34305 RepID=I3T9B4_LOTJA|nr:60S ribosomal protein L18a-like protein [Lotus japonicus]AFK49106.1 unknown [Lotus japonicus]
MGVNSSPMSEEEGTNRGIATDHHYYGTFQGVANYYPSPPPPNPNSPASNGGAYAYYQGQGQGYHALPVYAVAEGRPVRERRLCCCGLGLGWFLFITGFFLGGGPWYIGAFLLLCVQMDYREKPGLIACAVGSLVAVIAVTLGVAHPHLAKLT